ncbi:Ig-like domain-containing protein [uncultured Methanobrevibacter sp.]|uniref:Ig-like domain-containing protein n=1 Tax=uncultured Methanobrevibacter sp. TaxID=253161 RepID=UPI0025F66872|nr:Ig-like domain-containing protein [uncultured Methanobrevibacter sp.]
MKYKSIILILSIFILFSIASVSAGEVDDKVMMSDENPEIESTSIEKDLKTTDDNQVLSKTNDEEIQSVKDNEITGADVDPNTNATFDDLKKEIGEGGNITLKHKFYNYNGTGQELEFINLGVPNSVIDGNGAVIDMNGSDTQVFHIESNNITVKNLTIKNACRDTTGLAFYVNGNDAKILDCNFIDNNGQLKGVIFFEKDINGVVTNCTFINNKGDQYSWGGAIYNTNGNVAVTNCYFSGNSAEEGSDIYSDACPVTADTCIFTDTGTTVNVQIVPPALNVDDFVALNSSDEKITLDLKTNSGMSVDNGNISISVYDKNDSLIGEYSCLSGEGWAVDLPVGSYYAIFNTEYAGFEAINRTITVIPNTEYYINVTPVTTSNKTVTISAKSNIPTDLIGGRLVFILPNGEEINGTYDSNGTWMVVHTFDKYGTYEINATYTNFKIMTVNSATITVRKTNSTIHLDDIVLDYPESETVTVATEGATSITAKIDDKSVSVVDNFTIQISDLDAGNYTLAVTTIPDETHLSVTKTVTITVNKASVKIVASDLELNLDDKSKVSYALEPEEATGRIYFISDNPEVANVASDGNITALSAGTANITITFEGNINYEKTTKTIKVKVNKVNSTLIIPPQELEYKPSLNITVDATGATGIIAKINGKDAKTDGFTIEIPVDAGIYTLNVTTIPDKNHNPITKTANITVNKADTKIGANDLELAFGDKTKLVYVLMPEYAEGNITFSSSNPSVANVTTIGEVTALSIGTANITITFEGNKNYEKTTKTIKIKVDMANSTVNIGSSVLDYGNSLNITANATGAKGITAKIDGKDAKVNGYTIEIPVLNAGSHTLTVTTIPEENYNAVTENATITVRKLNSTLTVNNVTFDYKSIGSTTVTFTGATGVNATVLNQYQANVTVNGTNITISNLNAGKYTLQVTTIAEDNYNPVTKTASITVNKLKTTLNAKSIATVYNVNKNLVITLKDSKGNAISGANITVQLKDTKTYTTNKNGQITVPTKGLIPKTYTAKITFKGNTNYEKTSKNTVKVTVKKATPKITAKKKTFKRTVKTKKYSITLKTNQNKAMKGIKVTIKVNKKTYSAKTNKKGIATFKITKLTKTGKYTAVVKFAGNKYYNAKAVKQKIIIK